MKITAALLKKVCSTAQVDLEATANYINEYFPKFGIGNNREVRYWLAQCFEETDGLKTYEEYASGEKYEGRADLGNTSPGDGKRFKGRGMIQTTGKANYTRLYRWLVTNNSWPYTYTLMDKPEVLETPKYAVLSACFYYMDHVWSGQHIRAVIASGNFENLTKAVNGGLNGHQARLDYLGKLNTLIGKESIEWPPYVVVTPASNPQPVPIQTVPPLKSGDTFPPAKATVTGFVPELMALVKKYFGEKK